MKFPRPTLAEPKVRYVYSIGLFNILLVLLVFLFFLPGMSQPTGLSVRLPQAIASAPVTACSDIVSILGDDLYYFGDRKVSWEDLKRVIRSKSGTGTGVLIKADKRVSVASLVKVWDLFRGAGVGQVYLATDE